MPETPRAPGASSGLQGSFVMQKTGPLPNWAWMAFGLAGALGIAYWKSQKAKKDAALSGDPVGPNGVKNSKTGSAADDYYVFVDADSTVNTLNAAPPGGGRPPRPGRGPRPPDSPAPDGQQVSVVKWTAQNAPWNSTLYGIAKHLWGSGDQWRQIWEAPQNARLKELRKKPEGIQPGDKIWVPDAPASSGGDNTSGHGGPRGDGQGNQGRGPDGHRDNDDNQGRGRPSGDGAGRDRSGSMRRSYH